MQTAIKNYRQNLSKLFEKNDAITTLDVASVYADCRFANININQQDEKGRTILMAACFRQDNVSVRDLVRNGANVHIKDNDGLKAMDYAEHSSNTVGACSLKIPSNVPIQPEAEQFVEPSCCQIS
jgi:ankyrin repeat protein